MFQKEKPYGTYYNATVKRPGSFSKKSTFVVIGGIVAVLVVVLALLGVVLNRPGPEADVSRLAAKMNVLVNVANDARKEVQNAELNKINTNARLLFTTDKNNLAEILKDVYELNGVLPESAQAEVDPTIETRLEEAKLLNKYDIQYRAIMQEKITSAISAAQKAKRASRSKSADAAIESTLTNLKTIQQQLDATEL